MRESVEVRLLDEDGELYILARSQGWVQKERAMRRRRLSKLWKPLLSLQQQKLNRDHLLLKLGAAKKEAGRSCGLVTIALPDEDQPINAQTFTLPMVQLTS